ncbi:MAG: hypothetical protein U9N42_03935 [Campylobacterota bacterium]|nr:hypothetical protein [Campylobacterota bacterium]
MFNLIIVVATTMIIFIVIKKIATIKRRQKFRYNDGLISNFL